MDLLLILMPHLLIFSIKRLEKSRAKGNEKPTLMDLPNDFLFDVFARLPVKSLCHIRSVSKTSLSILDNPFFATLRLLPATNIVVVELPQLMLLTHSWSP
ncbi:hypothetical protein L3X38_039581 [Prunus dulcis]|uniref:F-box domain-containing protein n=1 Tax=Prunus dulcis TaxID=3755 RepID=A0AAD4V8G3_PRUDU|nr:hypothetical protein L3X38_039581 [Prunus dulcis]